MRRRTFDLLASGAGVVLAVILIVGGSLLTWAYNYVGTEVHNQLAMQDITFPSKAAFANAKADTEITPSMIPSVSQYAGQKLLSGGQAEAYADDFIAVHLREIGGGKTYSQLSAESIANPGNTGLASTVQLMFQGTTLRGLLLEAYAFGTMGTLAGWGALVCFIGAFLLLVLAALGFFHARQVAPEAELLPMRNGAASAFQGEPQVGEAI